MDPEPTESEPHDEQEVSDRIRAVVAGEAEACDWLVEWLSPLMLTWAEAQVRPGAHWPIAPADLVQDVWVRILPKLRDLEPHPTAERLTPALLGLVKRTLRNRVIDVRRQATRRRLTATSPGDDSTAQPVADSSGPFSKALRSERRRLVQEALNRLTGRERALYLGRIFEDASIDELAAEFDMTPSAVVKARQRARRRLEGFLAPHLLDALEAGSGSGDASPG